MAVVVAVVVVVAVAVAAVAVAVAVAVARDLALLLTCGFPSAATQPVGVTRRATCRDARRFSTRQGCLVEKSRRRSEPGARSATGAEAGRVSLGHLSLHEQRKVARAPKGSESFCSCSSLCLASQTDRSEGQGDSQEVQWAWGKYESGSLKAELSPLPPRPPCLRHSGSTPPAGFFYATQLRCSWGRGSRLTAPARSPGRSSASPISGSPLSRRKTTCVPARRPSGYSHRLRRCGRGP